LSWFCYRLLFNWLFFFCCCSWSCNGSCSFRSSRSGRS